MQTSSHLLCYICWREVIDLDCLLEIINEMEVLYFMAVILNFVIFPLIFTLVTAVSCGNSRRPKQEQKMGNNSQKKTVKLAQYGKDKSGSKSKSKSQAKAQKTSSTESRSRKSLSKSREQSSSSKSSQRIQSSRTKTEMLSKESKKPKEMSEKPAEKRDLKMEPAELRWNKSGGIQKVFISNPTDMRRAVKVKCSDNNLYRVNPVYSFIEPGQVLAIDILRQNGGAKVDKMVFLAAMVSHLNDLNSHAVAKKEDRNPRTIFQDNLPKPMMVLPLIAQ